MQQGMSFLFPRVLAAQAVLQTAVLYKVLARIAKRDGERGGMRIFALAALASLGTVAAEACLVEKAGWLVAVPALTVALCLFARHSWTYLWHALFLVLLFSSTYVALTVHLDRVLHPPPPKIRQPKVAAVPKDRDVVRYQQIADQLDLTGHKPAPHEEQGAEEAQTGVTTVTEVIPPPPPPPPPNPVNWIAAKDQLAVTGTMTLPNSREVAFVDGRMMQVGHIVTAEYRERIYRWRISSITKNGIEWKQCDVKDIPEPDEE